MGKLNAQAGSKLAKFADQEAEKKTPAPKPGPGMMQAASNKKQAISKTFRFASDDVMNLKEIANRVNAESRRNVSETKVVQALIQLGTKTETSRIIKSLGEIV